MEVPDDLVVHCLQGARVPCEQYIQHSRWHFLSVSSAIMDAAEAEILASTTMVTSTRQKGPMRRVLLASKPCMREFALP